MRYKDIEQSHNDHRDNYRSDGFAKKKGSRYSPDFHRVRWVLSNLTERSNILDVGCNGGTISVPAQRELNCYVRGIDIVPELIEKAVQRGVFATVGVAEKLEFPDNEFDFVVCTEVLEHLYDPMPAIDEAHRVLKSGGKYIVTVPHPKSQMAGEKLGDYHQQNFSVEELDTLFHCVFERGKVSICEIPYNEYYCKANGLQVGTMAWLGLEAIK